MPTGIASRRLQCFHVITPLAIIANALLIIQQHLNYASATPLAANVSAEFEDEMPSMSTDSFGVRFQDLNDLTALDFVFMGCLILLGLELNSFIVKVIGDVIKHSTIPIRGKHLDDLSSMDILFIGFNKAATPPFVYFLIRYMYYSEYAVWSVYEVTFTNLLLPLPMVVFVYDFFYTLLHCFLHYQFIYSYIHKHHHRQKAPSRATEDAVNVHPIEFFLGEYNHLFAVFIITSIFGFKMHILSILVLLILSGLLTGLNHTRFDVVLGICGVTLFDSKYHDVHHRMPRTNYGQYTVFWDKVFGTFRDYNENDRIYPKGQQLDPKTGKSFSYIDPKLTPRKVE